MLSCADRHANSELLPTRDGSLPLVWGWAPMAARAAVLRGNAEKEAVDWVEQNTAPCTLADLAVSGRDLLQIGIGGRQIGQALERLLAAVMRDPSLNKRETLLAMAKETDHA